MMPRVSCVGITVLDTVFRLPTPVVPGAKHAATSVDAVVGGPATNAAAAIVALGGNASLISKIGTDPAGDTVMGLLRDGAIDTERIRRVDGPTSQSAVIVDARGERTIANHTSPAIAGVAELPVRSDLVGSAAILVDARWPSGAQRAVELASDLGIPSLADIDLVDGAGATPLLAGATHVVLSRAALAALTGRSSIEEGLRQISRSTPAFVGVTMGSEGFAWMENNVRRHVPAIDITAVDTNGAGDAFHGAFALGLAEGLDTTEIIAMANAAAAHVCMGGQASERFASRRDVERLLAKARGSR